MRCGIVLAAGEATRLPNKPLLPLRNGRPAITSAIDFCRRARCGRVVIVVGPNSAVPLVLQTLEPSGLNYAVQREPDGVRDAITCAANFVEDLALITFCDNVYDERDCGPEVGETAPLVSVRWRHPAQLDWYDFQKMRWQERESGSERWCLAGWYLLGREHIEVGLSSQLTSVEYLNMIKARARQVKGSWHEVGTAESYLDYWSES